MYTLTALLRRRSLLYLGKQNKESLAVTEIRGNSQQTHKIRLNGFVGCHHAGLIVGKNSRKWTGRARDEKENEIRAINEAWGSLIMDIIDLIYCHLLLGQKKELYSMSMTKGPEDKYTPRPQCTYYRFQPGPRCKFMSATSIHLQFSTAGAPQGSAVACRKQSTYSEWCHHFEVEEESRHSILPSGI